jgi:hypothetical protein
MAKEVGGSPLVPKLYHRVSEQDNESMVNSSRSGTESWGYY